MSSFEESWVEPEHSNQEIHEKKVGRKKILRILMYVLLVVAIIIGIVFLVKGIYILRFRLTGDEKKQYETAITEFDTEEEKIKTTFSRFFDYAISTGVNNGLQLSAINSDTTNKNLRENVLDLVYQTGNIQFPAKYQDIYQKYVKIERAYYSQFIDELNYDDVTGSYSGNYPLDSYVSRLEKTKDYYNKVIHDKYFNPKKVEYYIDYFVKDTPELKTYYYNGTGYKEKTLPTQAKNAADEYCEGLVSEGKLKGYIYDSPSVIDDTEVVLVYTVSDEVKDYRKADVTVYNYDGTWKVHDLMFED